MKLEHSHAREEIARRLKQGPEVSYLRDAVYGGIDGAITTFAIVAGVVGADLQGGIVLILGVANLVADGLSMAAANYTGTRSELLEQALTRQMEERHIDLAPEGEREEVRQIFAAKGFEGALLEQVVDVITADRERWVQTMLTEEHGLPLVARAPLKAALVTFLAFVVCGAVPLLPFLLPFPGGGAAFALSLAMTGLVFFAIGSLKSRWSPQPFWQSGLETLAIGLLAAGSAYLIGGLLKSLGN